MTMEALISAWGLPALTLGCLVEGDGVAFVGGLMAHRGLFPVAGAWAAVAAGAMIIDNALFHLGRHSGRIAFVTRLLAHPVALRMMAAAAAHPVRITLGFRFVWGTRSVTPPVLGAAGVNAWLFFVLDALSSSLWAALYVGLGFGLGMTVERLWGALSWEQHLALSLGAGLALAAGLFALRRRHARGGGMSRNGSA